MLEMEQKTVSGRLMGGLGNQLFIMAAAFGYAKKYAMQHGIFLRAVEHSPHTQEMYEYTVFNRIPKIAANFNPTYVHMEKGEDCLRYDDLGAYGFETAHLLLFGYFQNERYMEGHEAEFLNLLTFPSVSDESLIYNFDNLCFLHVRRTDYLQKHLHCVDLWLNYYHSAIDSMIQKHPNVQFLVCSDDIEWCEGHAAFQGSRFVFLHEKDEVRSMEIMSSCAIGGICANSSFSWWSAYRNKNKDKTVIFPSKWFNNNWPNDIAFKGSVIMQA